MNQAGIRQIDFAVTVLCENLLYAFCSVGKMHRYLENPGHDVREDSLRCAMDYAQKIAAFDYHCFAGYQRGFSGFHKSATGLMVFLRTIKHCHDGAGVHKDGLQRPNPRM